MTAFGAVLAEFDDEKIVSRLVELYPSQRQSVEGYRRVIRTLRGLTPSSSSTCELTLTRDEWVDVSGVENGAYLAIDFTPWAEWLGMTIAPATLDTFDRLDIAAHALWEMTFHGYDEDSVREKLDSIVDIAAQDRISDEETSPRPV